MAVRRRFEDLDARRAELQSGGGAEKIGRQHEQGKLTARERLGVLFDEDTFVEFGLWVKHRCPDLAGREFPADGVVTGKGEVMGRPVFAFSQDFTVGGGAVGEQHAAKIVEMLATALKCGVPVVGFNDGGGARIQEGVNALSAYGKIFYHNMLISGVVPQISVVAGPCAGGAAYSPALTDFIIMVERTAHMFIAGPEVIRAATGEVISEEDLGGARAHAAIAGNIHFTAADEEEAVAIVKALLGYLPQNNMETPPSRPFDGTVVDDEALDWIIPEDPRARLRCEGGHHPPGGRRRVPRGSEGLRGEPGGRFRPPRRARRRHRRQSAAGDGRRARHQRRRQGGAVHPHLQHLQHPADHARGRAGVPARRRAGARRHHPPRREDALLLFGGDGAEADRHPAQGLRRRLPGHVLQGRGRGERAGLADRRDRGHGAGGGGAGALSQGDQGGGGSRRAAPGEDRRVPCSSTPIRSTRRRRCTSTTSSAPRGPGAC